MTQQQPERIPRIAYRVEELCAALGVSRTSIYRAIADGSLKSTKRLGARLIDAESVRALFGEVGQ